MDNCKAQKNDNNHNIAIEILPTFKGKQILKNKWYITLLGDSIQISKLRFYLTDFELFNTQDKRLPIPKSTYLIDAFNKQTLSFELHTHKKHNFSQITFKIGVDEKLHDAGAQSGDLDPIHGMYWAWQSGYINFKLEGESPSCPTRKNKFSFHIGGYKSPHSTTRNHTLDLKDRLSSSIKIEVDISVFFKDINLSERNQIMIPGEAAYQQSLKFPLLFSISK
ncbi:MAG: hypothetical protein ACJAXY_002462 [Nonlabens sp.]|jgi:hypothetical protein